MGIYEIMLIIYLPLWLIAVIDVAIGKFPRWYYGLLWLLVIFIVPPGAIIYLLFGTRHVITGGLRILHRKQKESLNE